MVFLSQEQILGEIVPDVLISKITLETATSPNKLNAIDPHLDLENKLQRIPDPFTGKLVNVFSPPNLAGFKTPFSRNPAFLKKGQSTAILQPLNRTEISADKLIVTVDLVLKEKLDQSLIGTWFKNQNFSKYIKLKVIQSTKSALTEEATKNKVLLILYDRVKILPLHQNFIRAGYSFLSNKLNLNEAQNIHDVLDSAITSKTLTVKDDIQGAASAIDKYTEIDQDGNTIITFTFRCRFELSNLYPEHLSYFAFTYLDLIQLSKDYGMTIDQNLISEPFGKVVSDIVIDNSELVGQSFVYTQDDGAIWVGPIRETEEGNIFGLTKKNTLIPIHKIFVGNSKIQDFRHINDLERLVFDFNTIQDELLNSKLIGPRNDNLDIIVPENTFSNMYLSRDEDGNSRFFFSINFRSLLEANAAFGKIFKTDESARIVMQEASILSMKILRRRIKGSPEIGSMPDVSKLFDSNQIDELIAVSGEQNFKNFIEINSEGLSNFRLLNWLGSYSLREISHVHTDISEGLDLAGIRHFTGIDKTMSSVSDGYYVYGVEMEIEDPSYNFILKKVSQLRNVRHRLNNYLQEATQITGEKTLVRSPDSHLDPLGNTTIPQDEVMIGNFDPYLNRFTQKFIDTQRIKYGVGFQDSSSTPWGDAVHVYLDNLRFFSQDSDVLPFDQLEKSLLTFTHPASGNPSGIIELVKLISYLENSISKIIGITPVVFSSYLTDPSSSPSKLGLQPNNSVQTTKVSYRSKTAIKSFKIIKFFNNIFNSNYNKNIGYDFLDISGSIDTHNGLKVISGEEYTDRVDRETNHYFVRVNGNKPDINLKFKDQIFTSNDSIDNTSFSYLTPAKIKFQEQFKITRIGHSPTPLLNKEQLSHLDFTIKSFNSNPFPSAPKLPEGRSAVGKFTQGLMNDSINFFSKLNLEPILFHNDLRIPLTDVINIMPLPRVPPIVDPLVDDNSVCATGDKKDVATTAANTNPIPVLTELTKRLSSFPILGVSPSLSTQSTSRVNAFNERATISHFDIASRESKINNVLQNPDMVHSETFFQGAAHKTTLEEALAKLPNQVKSILLARTNPDIVRVNWFDKINDPLRTHEDQTEFRLSYRLINTIQVLRGYTKSADGLPLLGKPLWEPLTLQIYNDSIGDALLCRMRYYENSVIGIERDNTLELPPFHEFFLLKPKKAAVSIQSPLVVKDTPAGPILKIIAPPQSLNAAGVSDIFTSQGSILPKVKESIAKENILQMAIRTEYMSNNIVNNSKINTFGTRLF